LSGKVEADETAIGGKPRRGEVLKMQREGETDLSAAGGRWRQQKKTTVFAMVGAPGPCPRDRRPEPDPQEPARSTSKGTFTPRPSRAYSA
jgi:hypothetical protein